MQNNDLIINGLQNILDENKKLKEIIFNKDKQVEELTKIVESIRSELQDKICVCLEHNEKLAKLQIEYDECYNQLHIYRPRVQELYEENRELKIALKKEEFEDTREVNIYVKETNKDEDIEKAKEDIEKIKKVISEKVDSIKQAANIELYGRMFSLEKRIQILEDKFPNIYDTRNDSKDRTRNKNQL